MFGGTLSPFRNSAVSDVHSFLSSRSAFKFSCGMELSPRADTRPDRPIHCVTLHVSLKKHIFQQILSTPKIMVQVCRNINKHHSSHQLVSCEYPTWITCQITARLPSLNYQIRVWLTWLPPRIQKDTPPLRGPPRRTTFHGILQVLLGAWRGPR